MSIRTKIGLILLFAVAGFVVAEYYVQQYIILPGFHSLERAEAVKNTDRIINSLNHEINNLSSLCFDWAAWDDAYDFVDSGSAKFIESNLLLTTFTDNNLNLIYICDNKGRVKWGKIYDLNAPTPKPLSLSIFPKESLPESHPLMTGLSHQSPDPYGIKGIVLTEKGPMLAAAMPILRSNDKGPSRGTFIMGRFIDSSLISKISKQTQVHFHIDSYLDATYAGLMANLKESADVPFVRTVDANKLDVSKLFPDITGNNPLIIHSSFHRKISNKGHETVRIGIYSTLIVGLSILVMVLVSLKKTLINPITEFTDHVLSIEQSGDFSKCYTTSQKDEIGILAQTCNKMTKKIEQSTKALSEANQLLKEDIKKRQEVEAALRESEERFRSMIEQAGDAVFLHDLNGNFRIVNQVACERLDYRRDELLTLSVKDIDPDSTIRSENRSFWQNISQQSPLIIESRHRRRDGSFFPVEISLNPILYSGEQLILAIARDITERKQLAKRARHSKKMEALSTLTAGLAHNFNNVLTIIVGCTELALKKLPESDHVYGLLKKIESASLRAKDIVWQLIHFSQKYDIDIQPIQVYPAVQRAIQRAESCKPESIRLSSYLQTDCHLILGNENQIEQMMEKLIDNALESMKDGFGKLNIRLENISFSDADASENMDVSPGDYVRVSIRDTGHGIDPDHMDRIFDPYFSTKNFADGAGMGLSIVYGIVKSNGGTITVESEPGKGTQINILFPARNLHQGR